MTKVVLTIGTLALLALPPSATIAETAAQAGAANSSTVTRPVAGQVSRPGGKPGVQLGQTGGPLSSNLTAQECRELGGKTEIDDGGSCKLRMRCTIIHANGDVYSSCIDEAK